MDGMTINHIVSIDHGSSVVIYSNLSINFMALDIGISCSDQPILTTPTPCSRTKPNIGQLHYSLW